MGRKQLNHVQYKRNIHPDFIDTMDKTLNKLKTERRNDESIKKHVEHALDKNNS